MGRYIESMNGEPGLPPKQSPSNLERIVEWNDLSTFKKIEFAFKPCSVWNNTRARALKGYYNGPTQLINAYSTAATIEFIRLGAYIAIAYHAIKFFSN